MNAIAIAIAIPTTDEQWRQLVAAMLSSPEYVTFCFAHGVVIDGCLRCRAFPDLSRYLPRKDAA